MGSECSRDVISNKDTAIEVNSVTRRQSGSSVGIYGKKNKKNNKNQKTNKNKNNQNQKPNKNNQNQKPNKNNQNQRPNKNSQNQKANKKYKIQNKNKNQKNKVWAPSLTYSVMSVCDEIPPHPAAPLDSSEDSVFTKHRSIMLAVLLAVTIIFVLLLCFPEEKATRKK